MARRLTASPAPAWIGDLPVFERSLANGFRALVLPRPHSSIVVCDLYYGVGSVDEPSGKSGLAHFVEHMLFKGTERFPKGQIDRLAFLAAGQSNAETSEDNTHYWFAFPSDRWELALTVEADRMTGATFDGREMEAERHVIVEERARDLDSPLGRLDQNHLLHAYLHHPYRNPVLGWPDDLDEITVDDLRSFYRRHYQPDNAVLVVVGGVEPESALDRIESHFGALPAGGQPRTPLISTEPRQSGRREFRLVESESACRALFGWHTVPRGHPDGPALDILSDLLASGRRSRLWSALVESCRLASYVDASQESSRHAGQFLIQLESPSDVEAARLDEAVRKILQELANDGPAEDELGRARNRLEAAWRWEQEDLGGLAAGLGQFALWNDWRAWQADHRAALNVSAEDVRRVASTHLVDNGLTVGWSLPKSPRTLSVLLPADVSADSRHPLDRRIARPGAPPAPERPLGLVIPCGGSRLNDFRPKRTVLSNGLRLLSEHRPGTGTVALELFVDAGLLREELPGQAFLTGRMLDEGTTTRLSGEIAEAVEDVGGTLELGATGASMRVRAEDLPLALDILSDVMSRPKFPADALPWAKKRIIAELQADRDDPAFRADLLFRGLVYGGHPYARDPRGMVRDVGKLTLEDVIHHHARYFAPDNAFLVAVGDFEPRRLASLVRASFKPWSATGGHQPAPVVAIGTGQRRPKLRRVSHPGEQVHIILGHLGITRNHPDYDALLVLDHIFGSGPGFTDRLSRIVRDELALAYSVGGSMTDSADIAPGLFRVHAGTMPDQADRVVDAILEQVRAMHRGAFSDEEVDRARRYVAGSWVFDFQTVEQRAERLLELERWDLGLDEPLHLPERIAGITPGQVRRAARIHLNPEALCRVEFGPIRKAGPRDAECA